MNEPELNAAREEFDALKEFVPEPMPPEPGEPPEAVLGKRLERARNHYSLTVEALSRLTKACDMEGKGISPPSLARYESGDTLPGAREIRLLCDGLGLTPLWLIYGDVFASDTAPEEQRLLTALKDYVESRKNDPMIGNRFMSEDLKRWEKQKFKNRLIEARKPIKNQN